MGTKYSKEFREDALRLCEREGVSKASQKLGVTTKNLYNWQRAARLEHGEAPRGLRTLPKCVVGMVSFICVPCRIVLTRQL